jgi:CRP-like cAMP-binding protein
MLSVWLSGPRDRRDDRPRPNFRHDRKKREGRAVPEEAEIRNRILLAVRREARAFLAPRLATRPFIAGEILFRDGEPRTHAIFPHEGVVAIVARVADGRRAEMAVVGFEGFVGFGLLDNREAAVGATTVEVPGRAAFLAAVDLIAAREQFECVREAMLHYATVLIGQLMISAACNSLHSVEQRIARRLLETRDRMVGETFALTQQTLAEAPSLRRAAVGATCAPLQREGAIRYSRGAVTILDRERLEAVACECRRRIRGA